MSEEKAINFSKESYIVVQKNNNRGGLKKNTLSLYKARFFGVLKDSK
jgi:hypothetical protein